MITSLFLCFSATGSVAQDGCGLFTPDSDTLRLFTALQTRNLEWIRQAIAPLASRYAGQPVETAERYRRIDMADADRAFTAAERAQLAEAYLDKIESLSWWLTDTLPDPRENPRAVTEIIRGTLAIAQAYPAQAERATRPAEAAGDYVVAASAQAEFPGAPFPYWRDRGGRLGALSENIATRLDACGQLDASVVNGWFIVEALPWEYYFDTGLVGEAMAELNAEYPKDSYAAWIGAARDWIVGQPLSYNFNYNAFTAHFLAQMGDAHTASETIQAGVLPGMAVSGQWNDPHNNRIVYRVIMVRALVATTLALHQAGDTDLAVEIGGTATTALRAVETQLYAARGVAAPIGMLDLYLDLAAARAAGAPIAAAQPEVLRGVMAYFNAALESGNVAPDASVGRYISRLNGG